MKTQRLFYIIAGSLICLLACHAQSDVPATPAQPDIPAVPAVPAVPPAPTAPQVPSAMDTSGSNIFVSTGNRGGGGMNLRMDKRQTDSVLLIPAKLIDAEVKAQLSEDMQVMSMIFEEAVAPDTLAEKYTRLLPLPPGMPRMPGMGGMVGMPFGFRSLPGAETIWLDGYGMIFTLEVDFPLLAVDGNKQKQPQTKQDKKDEVWQRSQNRLKGVDQPDWEEGKQTGVAFDPDRVQQLQDRLIKALKHASNIRNLADQDRLVVVVRSVMDGDIFFSQPAGQDSEATILVPTSVMTLQAAKQDIDAFAADKIDLDAFAKKVAVVIY